VFNVISDQSSGSGPTLTSDPDILKPVIDPVAQPKFVNPLPDLLAPSYQFSPQEGPNGAFDYFRISMREFEQSLGLRNDTQPDFPLLPPVRVWGYGDARGSDAPSGLHSYPGPTFVRKSTIGSNPDKPIKVIWTNEIPGGPDYHLMGLAHPSEPAMVAIDTTMMCGRNAPYCRPFQRLIPHVHGGHNFDYSDGIPEEWFSPDFAKIGTQFWTPPQEPTGTFTYPLDQTLANLWYHDHATGITRLNMMTGLVGEFVLRDDNELALLDANVLPKYPYEQLLVVQDKTFVWNADSGTAAIAMPDIPLSDPQKTDPKTGQPCVQGSMSPECWVRDPPTGKAIPSITPEFFGNMILVNGQTWPYKSVEPRKYRLRLLDATDSRTFFFRLENRSTDPPTPMNFLVVGTEQGLLPVPYVTNQIILMPGERIDTVVDFTNLGGAEVVMTNVGPEGPFSPPSTPVDTANPPADPVAPRETTGQILKFKVNQPLSSVQNASVGPNTPLQGGIIPNLPAAGPERELILQELTDQYGRLILKVNGMGYLDPTTEIPALDSIETWDFVNLTADVHPMHIHLVKFQVVNRQNLVQPAVQTDPPTRYTLLDTFPPVRPEERGWKDTVQSYPDQVTRVRAKYDIPGIFIFHCHIISHEDYDKMRHYAVVMDPTGADLEIFKGPSAQPASSPEPVIFHARGLTGFSFPLPPQSHGFEFQFSVKSPQGGWSVVQPYSDASNFIWIPTAGTFPGTYIVRVDLRIPTTTTPVASAEKSYLLWGPPPQKLSLSPANASITAGSQSGVTFSAVAFPAAAFGYEFRFQVQAPGSQAWSVVQDFSSKSTMTWIPPATPGFYGVRVDSRATGSTSNGDISATTSLSVFSRAPSTVTLSKSSSIQKSSASPKPVTFTVNAFPADGTYEYRFQVKNPIFGWILLQDYAPSRTITWTPPSSSIGLFTIQVDVRPAGGTSIRPVSALVGYTVY